MPAQRKPTLNCHLERSIKKARKVRTTEEKKLQLSFDPAEDDEGRF